jgi:hypothetical protein
MPLDMQALEVFLVDSAELSGSLGVTNSTAAAVAHFSAFKGFLSLFSTPRFSKIMRAVKLTFGRPSKPKKPFTRDHIVRFMELARCGLLLDWRAALPLALCYQQLLRGAKCFELNRFNVVRHPDFVLVEVELAKNNPDGFSFKIPVDGGRASCVGQFLADFIVKMGIVVGNPKSFFPNQLPGTVLP